MNIKLLLEYDADHIRKCKYKSNKLINPCGVIDTITVYPFTMNIGQKHILFIHFNNHSKEN